ncbi:MAG: PKD domain-containing protein [Solirubrobacteraceae bacterium]
MRRVIASLILTLAVGGCGLLATGAAAEGYTPSNWHLFAPRGAHLPFGGSQQAVCSVPSAGAGHCLIHVLAPSGASPAAQRGVTEVKTPTGLSPSTVKSIYGYSASTAAGTGQTIAIVDAYNDPDAASNLETFSRQYGLPAASFTQVNQEGGSSLPATESGWDLEISLDIEWAHAIAPGAHILLVEAKTASLANLLAAESYAAKHAGYVSNSWGASEFSGESADDSYFTAPGVSYFAAAGDEGGAVIWPSASPDVTSVGGTGLTLTSGGTLAQEEAWSGGGGGCSRYETASLYQATGSVSCAGKRATPDISLDANPNSGVSVYDGVTYERQSGWWTVGGTSASTVMIAARAADSADALSPSFLYASPANLPYRDILLGSDGHPTLTGYDLATGLGSWSYTPGTPTGLTASKEAGGVNLQWSPPSGIAAVSEYVIWRGSASGQESTKVASVPASETSLTDTEATGAGATYYYEVQALNGAGVGPFSGQAIAAPPSVPPAASFSTSCAEARCSFTSTSTDAAGTTDAYAWNGGNSLTGTASSFTDTYSAAGAYTVSLRVSNTAGQSSTASGKVTCTSSRGRFGRTTLTCT